MRTLARIAVVAGLIVAGGAIAQQVPVPDAAPAPKAPPAAKAPAAVPAEEPPPAKVAPPPPIIAPPPPLDIQPVPEEKPAPRPRTTATAKAVEPVKRVRSGVVVVQALDKVTAETMRFEVPVGQSVRYKSLIFTARACESAAPDEDQPESAAYLLIESQPKPQPGRPAPPSRQVFKGWMYASSPGLNPLQHPVYDAWLIACKAA